MRKRITSLLLTLVMLLSLVPAMGVTASAGDDTSYTQAEIRNYYTFASYLRSSESRDLKLMEDIDYTVGINDLSIDVIRNQKLDLNGHKITINASRRAGFENLLCIRRGEFTLYDSKGGGELAVSFPNDDKAYSIIMMSSEKKDEPAKFTMNGGTLTKLHPNMTYTYGASGCIGDDYFNKPENGKRSQITINGGTINCPYDWDRSQSLLDFPVEAMPLALQLLYSNLTINGGTFNGIVWTDTLWRGEQDTEPRVVLNGGEFNSPFVVEGMQKDATQIVIDGAHFKDGFHVNNGYSIDTDVGTVPVLLLKSGVFDSPDKNPKLDIYNVTANSYGNGVNPDATARARLKMILHAMKCFPNSAIKVNGKFYTSENIESLVGKNNDDFYLKLNSSTPIEVIRDAWGVMESVTLDGTKTIKYAKDWQGGFEEMDNSTAHTLKFEWYPLAQELKDAGYSYRTTCEHYISGSTAVQRTDTIAADKTSHTITIPAGADPKVYSFALHLNLKKGDKNIGIISNEHIVKLVVNQAPPAPPAPVAHSITVTNGRGTANTTSAFAGDTVTVTAKDDTANNMMFTRWNTETAGVTFADATKQETTFVMPDCDVKVNPGFQQVSFRKQPIPQISLEKGYGGKTSFVFSWDISKWELVDTENDQTVSSDDTPVKAGKLTDVTIPANTDLGSKTYRIVVTTANGEQFKSNDFIVTWFEKMPAPLVEFSIPSGTKFIGELTVNVGYPSTLNDGSVSPYEMRYTTNGDDPKDANPSDVEECHGRTDVTLTGTTTIKARTILKGEGGNADTWGELCEATYTMIDKLDAPTVTPESCSYSGSLPIIVTIQDVYNAEINYTVKQHDGYSSGKDVAGPMLETRLPDTFCGTTTFSAKAIVYKDGGGAWESDEVTYTYTREYWANISNATISGKVNEAIADTDVTITLDGEKFKHVAVGDDVSGWFTNRPAGLTAKVKELNSLENGLTVTISGTPTATSAAAITVTIPKDKLLANGTVDLTVLSNPKAVYNIGTDATHTHDYSGQPYLYLDPGNHYQECKAGDGYNILAHEFTPWTDNGNGTHSRHCTVCKMPDGSDYTETAEHTWVWVVDQEAALGQPGKQHEECTGCHAKRSENTEIPALRDYAVTVTGGTATIAAGTPITRAMEGVEVTVTAQAPGGKHFVKWVVKAGGVTLANETSATTTFIMPATDVAIEANFEKNASTGGGGGGGVTTYPITVKSAKNGDVTVSPRNASKGTTVTLTVEPDKGYTLETITVTDKNGDEIALTNKGDGKYTFKMPAGKVYVEATFMEDNSMLNFFVDVPADAYYYDAVLWAAKNGITGGVDDTHFAPNATCTRAQVVTFLWRAAGSPAPKSSMIPFTDVPAGSYYEQAVLWAVENGITDGTSATTFSPDAVCSRGQIVTFLWRANGSPAVSGNSAFTDVASDAYYAAAVTWAEKNDITGGIGGGLFGSNNNCTRAQIVTFIYRSVK
ncbi:InlB B-repeat-containing protein [Dysosmobacter sp.]|uniref:InlB B-repeat-containing protein n=1 Tax=Dysosmobacter sp. TaxID=2591382 RepID=UPI002A82895F|nr:S-layer homology domain-containing protein [Dysosmobacter sp.]MCI7215687.1 S-layer homology domain-containing protein [Dysosmobacter sp.]MDY3653745.1 S-layer homology domain-containing protein [Dysosmobacter sp.]